MTVMVVEIYDALRSAGADDDKSRKAAEVLVRDERFEKIDRQFADVRADMAKLQARQDMLMWMVGITMAVLGGVFTGTILLLLRAFPAAGG